MCPDTLTPWNGVHVAASIPLHGMECVTLQKCTQSGMEWNAGVQGIVDTTKRLTPCRTEVSEVVKTSICQHFILTTLKTDVR